MHVSGIMRDMISFVEIFVCFFCEKEFGNRKSLRAHQDCCAMKPQDSEKVCSNSKEFTNFLCQIGLKVFLQGGQRAGNKEEFIR